MSQGPPDVLAAVTPVVDVLERLGVAYHIGGSFASSAYGVPRATADVDLVADLRPQHVQPFVDALQAGYYVEEATIREALQRRRSFNVIHLHTMLKVDVCRRNVSARRALAPPRASRSRSVSSMRPESVMRDRWACSLASASR